MGHLVYTQVRDHGFLWVIFCHFCPANSLSIYFGLEQQLHLAIGFGIYSMELPIFSSRY